MRKMEFCEKDLDFMVNAVAPREDKEKLKRLIREDESFRRHFTGHENLFRQAMSQSGILKEISPQLFFEVLLRRARKEMEGIQYTVERTSTQKIPVFDNQETLDIFGNDEVFYYLIHLLTSFVVVSRKTPQDIDIDTLVRLGEKAEESHRFLIHKRIGDVCLLILGIYPEHLIQDYYYLFFNIRPPLLGEEKRGMADYEFLGKEFYGLASKESRGRFFHLRDVLQILSENFYLAKKPLNFVSEKYLAIANA